MPKNRPLFIPGYPTIFGCHGNKENEIFWTFLFFHYWRLASVDISKIKFTPFWYFLSQQLSFKNGQKVQFQACSNIHVAMETKFRHKTKLACMQLFRFVSTLRMLYKLMSTHLCLLVILYWKLGIFQILQIMLLLWLPWIPNIETFWPFLFVHLRHKALVYIPYADTFNLTFAVKR